MIVTPKKNGKPQHVVDEIELLKYTIALYHFKLQVKYLQEQRKTVFDAVDGYHSIPLNKASQPMTTIITEWGHYQS